MSSHGFDKSVPEASLYQLAAVLRSAVDAIISIDALGRIESVNPPTEELFGYTGDELVGQNVKILMPEPDRSQHDSYIRAIPAHGSAQDYWHRARSRGPAQRWLDVSNASFGQRIRD